MTWGSNKLLACVHCAGVTGSGSTENAPEGACDTSRFDGQASGNNGVKRERCLAGSHGPAGEHLVDLMRHSEEVCIAVLRLSQRENYGLALEIKEIHSALTRIIAALEDAH